MGERLDWRKVRLTEPTVEDLLAAEGLIGELAKIEDLARRMGRNPLVDEKYLALTITWDSRPSAPMAAVRLQWESHEGGRPGVLIKGLVVDPHWRRQGIGSSLINHISLHASKWLAANHGDRGSPVVRACCEFGSTYRLLLEKLLFHPDHDAIDGASYGRFMRYAGAFDPVGEGRRLTDLRKKTGMSQARLAFLCGVNKGTISLVESGRRLPSYDLGWRMHRAMHPQRYGGDGLILAEEEAVGPPSRMSPEEILLREVFGDRAFQGVAGGSSPLRGTALAGQPSDFFRQERVGTERYWMESEIDALARSPLFSIEQRVADVLLPLTEPSADRLQVLMEARLFGLLLGSTLIHRRREEVLYAIFQGIGTALRVMSSRCALDYDSAVPLIISAREASREALATGMDISTAWRDLLEDARGTFAEDLLVWEICKMETEGRMLWAASIINRVFTNPNSRRPADGGRACKDRDVPLYSFARRVMQMGKESLCALDDNALIHLRKHLSDPLCVDPEAVDARLERQHPEGVLVMLALRTAYARNQASPPPDALVSWLVRNHKASVFLAFEALQPLFISRVSALSAVVGSFLHGCDSQAALIVAAWLHGLIASSSTGRCAQRLALSSTGWKVISKGIDDGKHVEYFKAFAESLNANPKIATVADWLNYHLERLETLTESRPQGRSSSGRATGSQDYGRGHMPTSARRA